MVYQNKGWIRPGDWLGTGNIGNSEKSKLFLSIEEAIPIYRKLCKENNIKNLSDWRKFSKTHGKLLQELHLPSKFLSVYNLEKAEKRLKK
jgi:hypothetical protein